jgi:hypothetical protein
VATRVRPFLWLTADRCDGTLTRVTSGAVAVRERVRRKTVIVRAGPSYLARAALTPATTLPSSRDRAALAAAAC